MQIKTYVSKNFTEGIKKIKKDLGAEAIILSTKDVPGADGEEFVEIVAAIDHENSGSKKMQYDSLPKDSDIKNQLMEIKNMLSLFFSSRRFLYQLRPNKDLANVYNKLILQGLNEVYAWELIQNLAATMDKGEPLKHLKFGEILKNIFEKKIKISTPFHENGNSKPVFFSFVGPTGAGKTTTLAKLAAHLKLNLNYNIGFMSLDNFRIGAIEQLKIYAQILGVPLEIVSHVKEITQVLIKYSKLDFVLIDTIGRNFLNQRYVIDMKSIFDKFPKTNHLLVLSANNKDNDLKSTIKMFEDFPIHSFIFTKIDETTSFGNIINQLFRFQRPVCYLGTGQRVPEDIEHATKEILFDLLMDGYVKK